MSSDKRITTRISALELPAKVSVIKGGSPFMVSADILDISQYGIRLKLHKPLPAHIEEAMDIETYLPISGKPVNITATIVHGQSESEFGLLYMDVKLREPIDELINECRKQQAKQHKLHLIK